MRRINERQDSLERWAGRVLSEQPLLTAPGTLELRVLAQIERQAGQWWWQRDFARWPVMARMGFVLASLVIVKFVVGAAMWIVAGARATPVAGVLDASVEKVHIARDVLDAFADTGLYVLNAIPSYWLYAGVLCGVVAYATCCGLGVAAYKALYK